ncbi:MAG: hypothetical protein PUF72_02265 [Clostridiales bacterium]|nr:hypothetical protein [Clostridiales bacterium]
MKHLYTAPQMAVRSFSKEKIVTTSAALNEQVASLQEKLAGDNAQLVQIVAFNDWN